MLPSSIAHLGLNERPPLSKGYLTGKKGLDRVYLKEDDYYGQNNIEVITGAQATKVEPVARSVTLDDRRVLRYEKLLLATGGRTWRFALYYFDRGKMVGVLAVDRPDEERKPMQALVKVRPAYEDVADKLTDEGVDLETLAE